MLRIKLIFALIIFSIDAFGQYPGYSPVKDTADFRVKFTSTARNISTIKSDFTQEKNMSMLSEKIISTGKFWFKRDDMVRMEYLAPYRYLLIINKNNVTMQDGQKTNKVSAKSNKLFQQISRITVDCVQGTVFTNPDFKIHVFESSANYLIEMTPVTKGLKDFFSAINIEISKKDYSVMRINMKEQSGDNTIMNFTNKQINTEIPDAVFVVH
jgi:outer membrane lipoprotein-sorting protein